MLYTRFSADPATELIRAGYQAPSLEYLARHSSPADHVTEFCVAVVFREVSVGLEDDAVLSFWEMSVDVSLISSWSSERREASSALSGSATSASSTWESCT